MSGRDLIRMIHKFLTTQSDISRPIGPTVSEDKWPVHLIVGRHLNDVGNKSMMGYGHRLMILISANLGYGLQAKVPPWAFRLFRTTSTVMLSLTFPLLH